jgi:hypothetical protein
VSQQLNGLRSGTVESRSEGFRAEWSAEAQLGSGARRGSQDTSQMPLDGLQRQGGCMIRACGECPLEGGIKCPVRRKCGDVKRSIAVMFTIRTGGTGKGKFPKARPSRTCPNHGNALYAAARRNAFAPWPGRVPRKKSGANCQRDKAVFSLNCDGPLRTREGTDSSGPPSSEARYDGGPFGNRSQTSRYTGAKRPLAATSAMFDDISNGIEVGRPDFGCERGDVSGICALGALDTPRSAVGRLGGLRDDGVFAVFRQKLVH